MTPQDPMVETIERLAQENIRLKKRVEHVEHILSDILLLNSLGKTLKINEIIHSAIEVIE
jgi:hypothetical protein